jgi:hypothetical protein
MEDLDVMDRRKIIVCMPRYMTGERRMDLSGSG